MELNARDMTLSVRGKEYAITITELRLLNCLVRHVGHVLSREQLLDYVWEDKGTVTKHTIDVHVQRIREKLEEDPGNPIYLKTIRGRGCRFDSGIARLETSRLP
jgi:DNA-binding response OmpR family regulator